MIYITSDMHGDMARFYEEKLSSLESEDKLIVTGDFGFVFFGGIAERNNLDELSREKKYEILFLPGNHESYPLLETYPEVKRYGANVRKIRQNIFMLMTGNVYKIEGKLFFVFGGGYSPDKEYRIQYEARFGEKVWFPEEMPSDEEYERGIISLERCNWHVDYVLSHIAPEELIPEMTGKAPDPNEEKLYRFLQKVYTEVGFRRYYFGHYHQDRQLLDGKMVACYKAVHRIENEFV